MLLQCSIYNLSTTNTFAGSLCFTVVCVRCTLSPKERVKLKQAATREEGERCLFVLGGNICMLINNLHNTYHLFLFSLFHVAKVQQNIEITKQKVIKFTLLVSKCTYFVRVGVVLCIKQHLLPYNLGVIAKPMVK